MDLDKLYNNISKHSKGTFHVTDFMDDEMLKEWEGLPPHRKNIIMGGITNRLVVNKLDRKIVPSIREDEDLIYIKKTP